MTAKLANNSTSESVSIFISAPGKIILHGEHAVVHGKTALAAGLNLRSYLCLKEKDSGRLHLNLPDIDLERSWDVLELQEQFSDLLNSDVREVKPSVEIMQRLRLFLGYSDTETTKRLAVMAFLYLYLCIAGRNGKFPILDVLVSSALPPGAGLGSSAAFSVCLAAGLLTWAKAVSPISSSDNTLDWSKENMELINTWAYEGERVIHGNPSGIDNSISVHGGAIEYRQKVITPLENMPELSILLVNTCVARSTKELVAGVQRRHDKYPKVYGPILDSIEEISQECKRTLQALETGESLDGAFKSLGELVDLNQQLLYVIGVSHPAINNIVRSAAAYKIHAKLTGAGGGGCVFALLPPDIPKDSVKALQADLFRHNYESWITSLGAHGVMMHRSKETLLGDGLLLPESFLKYA